MRIVRLADAPDIIPAWDRAAIARTDIARRLLAKAQRLSSGCLVWNGSRWSNGYGRIMIEGRRLKTHRVAYETWIGAIPPGLWVRHSCDNPPCI